MKLYNELSRYYEILEGRVNSVQRDVQFLNEIFESHSVRNVLDVGCGTGLHARTLAAMGYRVTGIDRSSAMIEVARKKRPLTLDNLKFVVGDVTRNRWMDSIQGERYDAAISMYGVVNYILADEELEGFLEDLCSLLREGGLFVVEGWQAGPILMSIGSSNATVDEFQIAGHAEGDGRVVREKKFSIREGEGILIDVKYKYEFPNDGRVVEDIHRVRAFFPKEMERILRRGGFKTIEIRGGVDGIELPRSNRFLIVAVKEREKDERR
ncbi:MAG: class I SAM-dependent methyltransferase [bacterium]